MITSERAACAGQDPTLWDTDQAHGGQPGAAICLDCPLRAQCLAAALEHERGQVPRGRGMVFGGLTPDERYAIRAAARPTPPHRQCGSCGRPMSDLVDRPGAVAQASSRTCRPCWERARHLSYRDATSVGVAPRGGPASFAPALSPRRTRERSAA